MADDQDFEIWDDEFLDKAIQLTEAAVCSFSTNPTQPPPHLIPPPPPPHYASHISYSPPRELSQRVKEDYHRNFPDKGFDCPVSLNKINRGLNTASPIPHSSRLHEEDKCSKQQEINRLKEELGRVSKVLTNLEQECLELRKDREKNEKQPRSVLSVNVSTDSEAFFTKKSNLKNKDPFEESSIKIPGLKGATHCNSVGVQTDEHAISNISTEVTVKKNLSVTYHSRKLADIWEPGIDQKPRSSLVSKLFVVCGADLQVIFGCLGLNISSKNTTTKMDSNHCIQSDEAAKISHLYSTLTKISYDIGRLDDLLEALIDLCHVQNKMIVQRSLCVLHVVLKHILSMENKVYSRDKYVIANDPSTSEVNPHHPVLRRLINAKKVDDSSSSKWFSFFQKMHQIIMKHTEEIIRVEAVSIMNILLLRTNAYTEREMYGEVAVFETISQLLKKEAGVGVQKQTVDLLYLLLNCPNLMLMFCSSCKEEGTSAEVPTTNTETAPVFKGSGAILDGLADCLACHGNGAPTTLVLKLQRKAIIVVAFLASSGRRGFEIIMGLHSCRITNFLFLILQVLVSEIDVEASKCIIQPPCDDFRERTLVIREALILLNRLASSSQYSTSVLRVLTNRRDIACLTIDIATRLSRKPKCLWHQSETRQMRESEILDLARIFKKRVFSFLGDTLSLEK